MAEPSLHELVHAIRTPGAPAKYRPARRPGARPGHRPRPRPGAGRRAAGDRDEPLLTDRRSVAVRPHPATGQLPRQGRGVHPRCWLRSFAAAARSRWCATPSIRPRFGGAFGCCAAAAPSASIRRAAAATVGCAPPGPAPPTWRCAAEPRCCRWPRTAPPTSLTGGSLRRPDGAPHDRCGHPSAALAGRTAAESSRGGHVRRATARDAGRAGGRDRAPRRAVERMAS